MDTHTVVALCLFEAAVVVLWMCGCVVDVWVCCWTVPVHAAHGQVNVWVLEQHVRQEVLHAWVHDVRGVYDLNPHAHACKHRYTYTHTNK